MLAEIIHSMSTIIVFLPQTVQYSTILEDFDWNAARGWTVDGCSLRLPVCLTHEWSIDFLLLQSGSTVNFWGFFGKNFFLAILASWLRIWPVIASAILRKRRSNLLWNPNKKNTNKPKSKRKPFYEFTRHLVSSPASHLTRHLKLKYLLPLFESKK